MYAQAALPGALKFLTPLRPVPGSPQPTCKVSALYLENCANALIQTEIGLSSGSIVDNNSYLRSNEVIYYAVISYLSASKRFFWNACFLDNNNLLKFEHWCTVYNIYFISFFFHCYCCKVLVHESTSWPYRPCTIE